jgi:FxsC-like protein
MPDYSFFLSYASKDRETRSGPETTKKNDYVLKFFEDLDREMSGRGQSYRDGGFFDKKQLQAKWEPELLEGLASSRILVALYSPNYFEGEYSGKEWEIFNLRFEENENHRYPDISSSQVILPLFWKGPIRRYPKKVAEYQYQIEFADSPTDYKAYGLEYMVKYKRYTPAYGKLVREIAAKLGDLADGQGAGKVRDIPDFDAVAAFEQNRKGLTFVRYVIVAGLKRQMSPIRQTWDCYATFHNRKDWRPHFPDLDRDVEAMVTGPAKAESKNFEFLEFSPRTMEVLREARRLNNAIVVVVDPWSVKLPEMRQFLDDFDAEAFPNSAVLVNWNENDPETTSQAAQLQILLQDRFRGRLGRNEFHKDPVSSPKSIEQAVVEAFGAVRARLVELGSLSSAGNAGDSAPAPVIRN